MSQRTRALALLSPLGGVINATTIRSLRAIVEEAQNAPPDGKSDGAIDEAGWTKLRDICIAGEKLIRLIEGTK